PDGGITCALSGKGSKFPMTDGLAGGLPGAPTDYVSYRGGANGRQGETEAAAISGSPEPISWGVFPLGPEDAFYLRWNGGGGVNDPLNRPLDAIQHDLDTRTISPEAAASLYGAVIQDGQVDIQASQERRDQLRASRLAAGVSALMHEFRPH